MVNDLLKYLKDMNEEKIVNMLIAIIVITVFCIFSSLLSYFIIKLFMRKEKNKDKIRSNPFYLPLRALFIFIGLSISIHILKLPASVMVLWRKIFKIALICIVAKGLVNIVDPKLDIAKRLRRKDASKKDKTVANFTGRILKYIIYIFAVFFIISELGYDVSGLVAGLGIGGAIVALAAQDFVKSLIAGMSILTDKPFLVGDYIEVGTDQGNVIDISFRTTKIRTLGNTVVTFPNATLMTTPIINWSRLESRRYLTNLKLPLETNSDTIQTVVNRIRFALQAHEQVIKDSIEVHFDEIRQDGINIIIYLYSTVTDYNKFFAFKQEINEIIMKILESENLKLAYPGQNIYVINDQEK